MCVCVCGYVCIHPAHTHSNTHTRTYTHARSHTHIHQHERERHRIKHINTLSMLRPHLEFAEHECEEYEKHEHIIDRICAHIIGIDKHKNINILYIGTNAPKKVYIPARYIIHIHKLDFHFFVSPVSLSLSLFCTFIVFAHHLGILRHLTMCFHFVYFSCWRWTMYWRLSSKFSTIKTQWHFGSILESFNEFKCYQHI